MFTNTTMRWPRVASHLLGLALLSATLVQTGCKKDDEDPKAIAFETQEDYTGRKVIFTISESVGAEVTWEFGDGQTAKSNSDTISHVYASSGNYVVKVSGSERNGNKELQLKERIVKIATSYGDMYIWLYDQTPIHKNNFLKLSHEGFYTGTTFHRVIQNFVIQGGDPLSKDSDPTNDGTGGPGYTLPAEIRSNLKNDYGTLATARLGNAQNPNKESSGSQFYVNVNKSGNTNLNNEYTVFGYVMQGMTVADDISKAPKNASDRPNTNIDMTVSLMPMTKAEIKAAYGYDVP